MFGEIGAELQSKCTDENRIPHQECLYGKNRTYGPLPKLISVGSRSMPMDW